MVLGKQRKDGTLDPAPGRSDHPDPARRERQCGTGDIGVGPAVLAFPPAHTGIAGMVWVGPSSGIAAPDLPVAWSGGGSNSAIHRAATPPRRQSVFPVKRGRHAPRYPRMAIDCVSAIRLPHNAIVATSIDRYRGCLYGLTMNSETRVFIVRRSLSA